tara:strand:- start:38173 stop:38514 length:342 start_codon:yes stop_codon:yes gene_type:complete
MGKVRHLPPLLTEREAATELGVSIDTMRRMRKAGEVQSKKIGGRYKYRVDWLNAYIEDTGWDANQITNKSIESETTGYQKDAIPQCGAERGSAPILDKQSEHHSALMILREPS